VHIVLRDFTVCISGVLTDGFNSGGMLSGDSEVSVVQFAKLIIFQDHTGKDLSEDRNINCRRAGRILT